jgi:hypothetical protein
VEHLAEFGEVCLIDEEGIEKAEAATAGGDVFDDELRVREYPRTLILIESRRRQELVRNPNESIAQPSAVVSRGSACPRG